MGGKFPPIGQELGQGLQDSKTNDLNCLYRMRHLSRKKHWPHVKMGIAIIFMCSIIIISFRKVHKSISLYWLVKEEHPCMWC